MNNRVDLSINLNSLSLKNPIMPASGTFDIRDTILNRNQLNALGAVVTKSISLRKRAGNPGPRIWETDGGMLNAVGIPSDGFEEFVLNELLLLKKRMIQLSLAWLETVMMIFATSPANWTTLKRFGIGG